MEPLTTGNMFAKLEGPNGLTYTLAVPPGLTWTQAVAFVRRYSKHDILGFYNWS